MLYTCPLLSVSFCGVLPSSPKVLGLVARHPAADSYHCYLLQSSKFVSVDPQHCSATSYNICSLSWLTATVYRENSAHGLIQSCDDLPPQTPLLVSIIGDAFLASQRGQSIPGGQDMVVEALRHKVGQTLTHPKLL